MRQKVKNPFRFYTLYHYYSIFNLLSLKDRRNKKILDLGCGDGEFIGNLRGFKQICGFDVDREKVLQAKRQFKHVKFTVGKVGSALPYKNNYFDIIFLFHVLEHVDSEKKIINEVYRILKKNGELYIASPYKGIFSWADVANLRYRFPLVHEMIGRIFFGNTKYSDLFIEISKRKLFGDSSLNRNWHKHYKEKEIRILLKDKFEVKHIHKFSLFQPFLLILINLWRLIFRKDNIILNYIVWLDNKLNCDEFSYNFYVIAEKK